MVLTLNDIGECVYGVLALLGILVKANEFFLAFISLFFYFFPTNSFLMIRPYLLIDNIVMEEGGLGAVEVVFKHIKSGVHVRDA